MAGVPVQMHVFPGHLLFLFIPETPHYSSLSGLCSSYRDIFNLHAWQAGNSRELVYPKQPHMGVGTSILSLSDTT